MAYVGNDSGFAPKRGGSGLLGNVRAGSGGYAAFAVLAISALLFSLACPAVAQAADSGNAVSAGAGGASGVTANAPADDDFNESFSRIHGDAWPLYADTSWYHGTGSYTLTTAEQLAGLAKLVYVSEGFAGCTITLGADIDLSDHEWFSIGRPGDVRTGADVEPARAFSGVFDGAGHTISGLTMTRNNYHSALFGYTRGGLVENLSVSGEVIADCNAAGIVACADGTNLYNLVNYVDVTGADRYNSAVGGVFGRISGTGSRNVIVQECVNYGTITAGAPDNGVGGIGGSVHETDGVVTLVKCENHGQVQVGARAMTDAYVDAAPPGVGGIVGSTASYGTYQIQGCYNDAPISCAEGVSFVGGVAGNVGGNGSSVSYSYNVGDLSSAGDAAGVVSRFTSENGSVACTYNAGMVSASGNSGGIAAAMSGSAVHNYYLEGTAASGVGGANDTKKTAAACTVDYLYSQELLDNLNYGAETAPPFSIEAGRNNGMPILYGSLNPGKGGNDDASSRGSDEPGGEPGETAGSDTSGDTSANPTDSARSGAASSAGSASGQGDQDADGDSNQQGNAQSASSGTDGSGSESEGEGAVPVSISNTTGGDDGATPSSDPTTSGSPATTNASEGEPADGESGQEAAASQSPSSDQTAEQEASAESAQAASTASAQAESSQALRSESNQAVQQATEDLDIDALDVGSVVVLKVAPEKEKPEPDPETADESALVFGLAVLVVALWGMTWKYVDFYTQRGRRGNRDDAPRAGPGSMDSALQAA